MLSHEHRPYLHPQHNLLGAYHFRLRDSHPRHLRFAPYFYCLRYSGFYLYSCSKTRQGNGLWTSILDYHLNITLFIIPRYLPLNQRNTLGCLAADCPIFALSNLRIVISPILWCKALRGSQQLSMFYYAHFCTYRQEHLPAIVSSRSQFNFKMVRNTI